MLIASRVMTRLRSRDGFTLIEVLVAMVTGVIVTGALFAILEVSVRQSSHLSNVAQATELSRTAMTRIVDPLHSACVSQNFAPVKEGSSPTKLIFVNAYDEASGKEEPPAELPPAGIHKDEIEYNEAAGTLKDKRYTATSNVATKGEYTWSATTATTLLGEKVTQAEEGGKKLPVFQYFAYNTKASSSTSSAASALKEESIVKTGETLTEAGAAKVGAVQVSFRMQSNERKEFKQTTSSEKGAFAEQSTLNTFSFMSPDSETSLVVGPCE